MFSCFNEDHLSKIGLNDPFFWHFTNTCLVYQKLKAEALLIEHNFVYLKVSSQTKYLDLQALRYLESLLNYLFEKIFQPKSLKIVQHDNDAILSYQNVCPSLIQDSETLVKMAHSKLAVFISGETGVGKSFLASHLHDLSQAKGKKVVVALSTLPHELFEAELFGTVAGAYTDGLYERLGRVGQAENGTLILEEIADLSIHAQSKLFELIDSGRYLSLGGNEPKASNAKLIFTSKHSLETLVKRKLILPDLLFRLNALQIHLKSIQNRPEDIKFVVDNFALSHNFTTNQRNSLIDTCLTKNWPGNFRELIGYLETLKIGLLKDELLDESHQKSLRFRLERYKKMILYDTLSQCNGNITKASKELGIQRSYLSKLVNEMNND